MLKIAVTGNMGSGKSSICHFFEILGTPVFYADVEAKKILNEPQTVQEVVQLMGKKILKSDHTIDKQAIAQVVFNEADKLQKLNAIIHPKVHDAFEVWAEKHITDKIPYVLYEAALVFETRSENRFDLILVVHAPTEVLIQRSMQRDGATERMAKARLSKQWAQEEKMNRAHISIENNNRTLIIPQLLKWHEQWKIQYNG